MGDQEKPERVDDIEVLGNEDTERGSGASDQVVLARHVFPGRIPIIPLRHKPIFPRMIVPMIVENPVVREILKGRPGTEHRFVGLLLVKERADKKMGEPLSDSIASDELYTMGVVAEVLQVTDVSPDVPVQTLLSALARFKVIKFVHEKPHIAAEVEYFHETDMSSNDELKAYAVSIVQSLKDLMQLNPLHKEELHLFMSRIKLNEPGQLADFGAALTTASPTELQEILETVNVRARLKKVFALLKREVEISRIQAKISKQIEEKISKQQRKFFLREQLKAIKKELGISKEGKEAEAERFEERLTSLKLSAEAGERVKEELEKLKLLEQNSPEFAVTRTYLDWLTVLPWGVFTADKYNLARARKILNADHFGLSDVKERILEFLSVGIKKGRISGTILCFVGPPGVGKTSLGHSIAKSIGRNFYRFSLGGMRDEAEIKGHRRTYIGALPGKFIQAMKISKSSNPVIMLDEIDKIGASYQGDPASALLEVLDPEQNHEFLDHYLDVRFDLSNVFFICTANQLDTIPRPLLDRMEVIKLAGYILEEKQEIAKRFLIPKQLEASGVTDSSVRITDRALREIIDGYAREPGVRGLENLIKKIIRKSVKRIVEKKAEKVVVDKKGLPDLIGNRIFIEDTKATVKPGVVTGLAWTSLGGDTMTIEATGIHTGKAGFKQTGQLGNVMVESSEIAYTFIRSFLSGDKKSKEFFEAHSIHLHVPAGATPKDGPSAGITMAVALYSLVTGKSVMRTIAMTGEITLTGRVMPVGGIKEKTIAAKRAGIKYLIFPRGNKRDFEELPAHIRKNLKVWFTASFDELVDICFSRKGRKKRG